MSSRTRGIRRSAAQRKPMFPAVDSGVFDGPGGDPVAVAVGVVAQVGAAAHHALLAVVGPARVVLAGRGA